MQSEIDIGNMDGEELRKGKVKKYNTLTQPGEITFLFALHFVLTKTLSVVLLINMHPKKSP